MTGASVCPTMAPCPSDHRLLTIIVTVFLSQLLAVFVGSAAGGAARFWAARGVQLWFGRDFPLGTFFVNISGALLIGVLAALLAHIGGLAEHHLAPLLLIGVCGSYTTVSSFALDSMMLLRDRRWLLLVCNLLGSMLLCLTAVWMGYQLTAQLLAPGVSG